MIKSGNLYKGYTVVQDLDILSPVRKGFSLDTLKLIGVFSESRKSCDVNTVERLKLKKKKVN